MKRIMMSLLLAVAVVGMSFAQDVQPQAKPEEPQLTEEQKAKMAEQREILNIRLQIIKQELKLSDVQYEKFAPVYREYNKAKHFALVKREKIDWSKATKAEINAAIKSRLDNTINTAMVRKTYILIFEEVISPKQLMKLYKIEDELVSQARKEYEARQSKQQ